MKRALVLTHVAHEGPGRILDALERAGLTPDVRRLFAGDALPSRLDEHAALVVMGGPMGVSDVGSARYPFLARELEFLRLAVEREFPVLGMCLGSQLLAAAAGARVYPNVTGDPPRPTREVGWGAVHFVRSQAEEPVLSGLDAAEVVLHWHGDTFDLPSGATLLASTLPCVNQMYRLGRRQLGLQFHVELTEPDVLTWLEADREYVIAALGPDGPDRIVRDTRRFLPRFVERGDRLLDNAFRLLLC
jgi:GMP synthase-like glutamine amidotransferase